MDFANHTQSHAPRRPVVSSVGLALAWYAVIAIAQVALHQGLELRHQIWDRTANTYFHGDIHNAYEQGATIMRMARECAASNDPLYQPTWREFFAGYIRVYPGMIHPDAAKADYPPFRLLAVGIWVKHVQAKEPWRTSWEYGPRDAAESILAFNTVCGAAAAIGMFLLVWYCMWREQAGEPPVKISPLRMAWWVCGPLAGAWFWAIVVDALRNGEWPSGFMMAGLLGLFILTVASVRSWPTPYRYFGCGLIAALMTWFNAAILINGYAWPQWEVWPLPFFIFAALLATMDWWFMAGVLVVVGGMFKGQMFLVAPLFIFWPLFQGRPGACVRWAAGAIFTTAAIVSPWLLGSSDSRTWMACVVGAALLMSFWFFWRPKAGQAATSGRRLTRLAASVLTPRMVTYLAVLLVATGVVVWPLRGGGDILSRMGCLMLIALLALPRLLPARRASIWLCLILGVAVFVAGDRYGADWNWYNYGFKYGTEKFDQLVRGTNPTLPGLMVTNFGWDNEDMTTIVGGPFTCGIKTFLASIYGVCLLVCAAGCAIQHHRRDTRLLVALVAPWLLFTTIMAQMTVRYWLWSAALSAAFVGVSVGMSLFQFLLTATGTIVVVSRLVYFMRNNIRHPWQGSPLYNLADPLSPDLAWMLMLICLIYLWVAVAPRRKHDSNPSCTIRGAVVH